MVNKVVYVAKYFIGAFFQKQTIDRLLKKQESRLKGKVRANCL